MGRAIYPQVQGGYRWNMWQRIIQSVGVTPTSIADVQMGGVWQTIIDFAADLTSAQQSALDTLMASNPTFPPADPGSIYKVQDLWAKLAAFNQAAGVTFTLWYSESVPGSGVIDTIELHTGQSLTTQQKNNVKSAYANLLSGG